MTEQELKELLANGEADRVEFTTSQKDTDKWSEAVCAFANDYPDHREPGYLLVGIDDSRKIAGMTISDELLRNLGGLRNDGNIQPLPSLAVEKVVTSEGEVAVVKVLPSELPPVRYKGRIFIRTGARRGYATEHDERLLIERRVAHARTFDALPCLGSTLQDLDLPLFLADYRERAVAKDVIEANQRSTEHQLAALRFFDLSFNCPTHAGILFFGNNVRHWLPGAYIQFLRVRGDIWPGDILNDRVLGGNLWTVLREIDMLIDTQIVRYPVRVTTLRDQTMESYPKFAVRELLLNAIMHRDYADTSPIRMRWLDNRIEIQNSGGLYGSVTPENFPSQSSYRNPVIAEAIKTLGFVNQFGMGVNLSQLALKKNGNPPAHFKLDDPHYVLAVIPGKDLGTEPSETVQNLERALALQEGALGPDHPLVAASQSELADWYFKTDRPGKAILLKERALKIYTKSLGQDHPQSKSIAESLARIKASLG